MEIKGLSLEQIENKIFENGIPFLLNFEPLSPNPFVVYFPSTDLDILRFGTLEAAFNAILEIGEAEGRVDK